MAILTTLIALKLTHGMASNLFFYCERTLPSVCVSEKDRSVEPINSSAFPGTKLSICFLVMVL